MDKIKLHSSTTFKVGIERAAISLDRAAEKHGPEWITAYMALYDILATGEAPSLWKRITQADDPGEEIWTWWTRYKTRKAKAASGRSVLAWSLVALGYSVLMGFLGTAAGYAWAQGFVLAWALVLCIILGWLISESSK